MQVNKFFIFAVLVLSFQILCLAPGTLSPDSLEQFTQSFNNNFTNWHPPSMAFVWKFINYFHFGALGFFILNLTLYWIASLIFINRLPIALKFLLLFSIMIFPSILCQFTAIWKDTHLAGILFLTSALLLNFKNKYTILKYILIFYAVSLRYNAVFAALPLIYLLHINQKRAFVLTCLVAIVFLSTSIIISKLFCIEKYPAQMVQSYDIAGISIKENKNLFPKFIGEINLLQLQELYDPTTAWKIFSEWGGIIDFATNKEEAKEISINWKKSIINFPNSYLDHRLSIFRELILSKKANLAWYEFTNENIFGFRFPERTSHKLLISYLTFFEKSFIFSGLFYILCNCIFFIIGIIFKIRELIMINLSSFIYLFSCFILPPGSDFRYIYWIILTCLISLFIIYNNKSKLQIKTYLPDCKNL